MRYKIKVVDHGDHKGASLYDEDKKNSVQLCEISPIPLWFKLTKL